MWENPKAQIPKQVFTDATTKNSIKNLTMWSQPRKYAKSSTLTVAVDTQIKYFLLKAQVYNDCLERRC